MSSNVLPISSIRSAFRQALGRGNRVVVTAPTGSGKSTRLPQFVLEDGLCGGRILVLQPRRLAARMLAERVSRERGVRLGEETGFLTRYEQCVSARSRIVFITAGILQRQLLAQPTLPGVGALLFDEFHERGLAVDLGLALAKQVQEMDRPDLKLAVLSATMDPEVVQAYLGGCPHIHASGRTFPVDPVYLPKPVRKDLWETAAAALLDLIRSGAQGDVLVFMPGVYEIRRTVEIFSRLNTGERLHIVPLYGDLAPDAQRRVMEPAPHRKVIVATNIAETSLTIPGVRHVIDSGFEKRSRYDRVRGFNLLELAPISRDSAEQRAGRAGREAPGTCRRLWTVAEQQRKEPATPPEVQRVDMAETVLFLHALGFHHIEAFPWFEAPSPEALAAARGLLRQLKAIDGERSGVVTPLGRELSRVPAHPRIALLLREAARTGCYPEGALAAAILTERPLVTGSRKQRSAFRRKVADGKGGNRGETSPLSDLLVLAHLLQQAERHGFAVDVCREAGIHAGAARQAWRAVEYFRKMGERMGWHTAGERGGKEGENLVKCLLRAFPDRLARRRDRGSAVCELSGGRRGELSKEAVPRDAPFVVAAEIREISRPGRRTAPLLSLVSGVREEWLWEIFPDDWRDTDEIIWDDRKRQVFRRRSLICLGVLVEESVTGDVPPDAALEILVQQVAEGRLRLKGWGEEVDNWIARVRWVADRFPERGLRTYDPADLRQVYAEICGGAVSYRQIKDRPCLYAVRRLLSPDDVRFVEHMAPSHIRLPRGRRMRILYKVGSAPKGKATIQDFYGLERTPGVAGGRVAVLLEILAPNLRTVQITDDLEGFWREIYPRAKKELARRYPKHEWK